MANGVPFRKNAQGTWEIQAKDGQWHTSPEWQSVLANVRSVKYDPAKQDYVFSYMLPGTGGGSGRAGTWGLADVMQMYSAASGSPVSSGNQPTNIHEAWYASNQTAMPDIWMRNDLQQQVENQYGDPIIDPEKLERVIDILRNQGAWDMGEPESFSVPGVREPFVRVGDRIFKGSPSYSGADGMTTFDIPGTDYKGVMGATGGITTVKKSAGAYTPGMLAESGPGSINLPGYDILQDRSGELTPYAERYTPNFHIDPSTMTPFIQQPDGRLEIAEMPTMDDLVTMYLQQGQSGKAVAMANFRDRPTSMEYFNATMEWARTPADVFTVSAIVRGLFTPQQGDIGDIRRIGPPPSWAKDAWVGLQSSMGLSAQDITAAPGDQPGSFVAAGNDPAAIPNITTTMSIPSVVPADSTVTPQNVSIMFDQTGVLAADSADAAAMDADFMGTQDVPAAADMFGGQTTQFPDPKAQPTVQPTFPPSSTNALFSMSGGNITETAAIPGDQRVFLEYQPGLVPLPRTDYFVTADTLTQLRNADRATQLTLYESLTLEGDDLATQAGSLAAEREMITVYSQDGTALNIRAGQLEAALEKGWLDYDPTAGPALTEAQQALLARFDAGEFSPNEQKTFEDITGESLEETVTDAELFAKIVDQGQSDILAAFSGGLDPAVIQNVQGFDQPTGEGDLIPGADDAFAYPTAGGSTYEGFMAGDDLMAAPNISAPADWKYGDNLWWQEKAKEYAPMTEEEMFSFGPGSYGGAMEDFEAGYPLYSGERREFDYEQARRDRIEESARNIPEITPTSVGQANILDIPPLPYSERVFEQDPVLTHGEDYGAYSIGPDRFTTGFDVPYERIPQDFGSIEGYEEWGAYPPSMLGSPERFAGDPDYEAPGFYDMVDVQGGVAGDIPITYGTYQEPPPPPPTAAELSAELDVYGGSLPPPPTFPGPPLLPGDRYQEPDEEEEEEFIPEVETFDPGDFFYQEPDPGDYYEVPVPSPEPVYEVDIPTQPEPIYDDWAMSDDIFDDYDDDWDFFQFGGYSNGGTAMVGEQGPELVDLPPGARVMPAGITEMLSGRPTRRPRSLFRPAGLRTPSAQTISNLLPEEIEVYQEMGRLAGIPEKAFEREFRSMVPMGQGGTSQARFTPRRTGRTRYGSI